MAYQDTFVRSASHLNIDTLGICGEKKLQKTNMSQFDS